MPNKKTAELKKKYNQSSSKNLVIFRMNPMEKALLEKMMTEMKCTNVSAFLKYKLFGMNIDYSYKQMLHSGKTSDIESVLKNQLEELNLTLGYLNYRFSYELEYLKNQDGKNDSKTLSRIYTTIGTWKELVLRKTDQIFSDCQTILKHLNIKVERRKVDNIRMVPDEILEMSAKDWNDTTSPEKMEIGRRLHEKHDKEVAEKRKEKQS